MDKTEDNKTSRLAASGIPDIAVYKRRWAFLIGIFFIGSTSMFSAVCFGLVDDIFTVYFNISYAQGDWITLSVYATSCLVIPVLAWLCFANQMGIRLLILLESFSLTLSYLLIVLAIAFPTTLYLLIIFGQLVHGITNAIQWSIPPLFAVLWFANNEVGIAIAVNFVGAALGAGIGFIAPSHALTEPPSELRTYLKDLNLTTKPPELYNSTLENWKYEDRATLLYIFITMLAVTALLSIFFYIFLTDLPPKPPTIAQAIKRSQPIVAKKLNKENLKAFFRLLKNMFSDLTFTSLVIVYSIIHRAVMLEFTMMGELIRTIASSVSIDVTPDKLGSYIMIFYPVFAALGSITSGILLDQFAKYQRQAIFGAGMTFLSTIGIASSYYFRSFVAICIFNGAFGFSTRIGIIALLAVVTRHTFPVDESFVSIWITGFESIALILISELGRIFINDVSDISVLVFMCTSLCLSFILALLAKPKDKRLEAEQVAIVQETS